MKKPELTTAARAAASSIRTPISMGPVIKDARKEMGLSQVELAKMLGISRVNLGNWESDKYKPEFDLIPALCRILKISLEELFGMETGKTALNKREYELLDTYRSLSEPNKNVLFKTAKAMEDEENYAQDAAFKAQFLMLDQYNQGLAAGSGCDPGDMHPDYTFVRKTRISEQADSLFYVSGDSMLPIYHNDDYVYVESTSYVAPGADAVFFGEEGFFIKRVGSDGRPYSLNKDLPFHTADWNRLSIQGKVLGIVEKRDIPNQMEENLLRELFEEEIEEFRRIHPDVDAWVH